MLLLEQNKKEIINLYKSGISTNRLAEKYKCNPGTLWVHLKEWGISIKPKQSFKGDIEDYKSQIKKMLDNGLSCYRIAKELEISKSTIIRAVRRWNFNNNHKCKVNYNNLLKDREDEVLKLYNNGKTCDEIGKITGHSGAQISILLKRSDQDVRNWKYSVNEHFFDKVDSEEVAYVLGWFYSDGCVDNNGKLRIQIQKDDEYILYIIKDLMEYDGPLYEVSPPKKYPHRKSQVSLTINRKSLADKLIALGCVPNKSLILNFPSPSIISDKLMSHFIRGVFDGDGSISIKNNKYLNVSIISSESFLQSFRYWLINHLAIDTKHYYRYSHTTTMQMMITRTNHAKLFLDWMYRDANYYLTRKFSKYQKYLQKSV